MARKSNRALKLFWSALDKSQSLSSDRLGLHSLISSMLEDGETVDSFISDIRNQNRTIKGALAILKESSKLEKELKRLEYVSVRPTGRVLPALPSDEAWARYMKGRTPFNAENVRGTTEHVGRPIVRISKADYSGIYDKYAGKIEQGSDYYDMLRSEDIWPIVTSETAEQLRKVDRYNAFKEKLANRKRMMGDYPTSVSNVGKASKEERDRFLHERFLLAVRMAKAIAGRSASGIGEVKGTFYNEPISWRQQLGLEDTGVSSDFDYLREQEKDQKDRRKRAKRFWNRKHDESSIRRFRAKESFKFAMFDKDEQFIRGSMRDMGWSRDQAEQVYFKNLTENTKWLRFIARDNPKIAKNLIPIAKTIGKASGLPIVGSFASNPALAAITAAISGTSFVLKNADKANEVTKNWRNYENLYGKPTAQQEWNARLAGIKDPAKIAEIYGQLAVNFGGDPDMFLLSQGIALRGMDHKQKQLHAKAYGFTPEMVRLAEIYAGATPEESDIVDARIYALEREESEGWKSGSGFRKTLRSMQLKWSPFQKDLEARGWSWGKILALANPLMFGGQFVGNEIGNAVWDEVHDTAEIDDRYRAGMYDNSTTNNNGGDRSVTVIQNISAEVKNEDPVGFVKEMTLLGGRGKHEAESVLQNNDSLRTN